MLGIIIIIVIGCIILLLFSGMYEIIDRIADNKADVASVLLFTDGQANVGIDKKHDILEEMRKAISPPKEYAVR